MTYSALYNHNLNQSSNKVAAFIVSYNDAAAVVRCTEALQEQVASIIVVDNGSETEHLSTLQTLKRSKNVTLLRSPTNLGIGAAINLALETVQDEEIDWVLTMDQDSIAAPDMVETMLHSARSYPKAAFTPLISDIGQTVKDSKPVEVAYAITSGNLVPLAAMRRLNGLDADLFIDGVDFDFSLRLRAEGYQIVRVPAARMAHALGNVSSDRRSRRFYTDHSPLRRYYMARNLVLNVRRHALLFPKFLVRLSIVTILSFLNMLVYGPDRSKSIIMISRGIVDGLHKKTGAYARGSSRQSHDSFAKRQRR